MWKENLEIPEREKEREKHRVEEPQLFSSQLSESSQHRGQSEETFESPRPGRPLYNSTWVRDPNGEQLLSSTQSTPRTVSKIINVKSLGWLAMQQWIT